MRLAYLGRYGKSRIRCGYLMDRDQHTAAIIMQERETRSEAQGVVAQYYTIADMYGRAAITSHYEKNMGLPC